MTGEILTYDEACARLGIGRRRLFQLLGQGALDKARTGRRLANGHPELGVTAESCEHYGVIDTTDGDRPDYHVLTRARARARVST